MGRIAVAFLLGHCCLHSLAQLPSVRTAGVLAVAAALAALARSKWLAGFVAGLAWAWLGASARLAQDLPTALEGRELLVTGHVASPVPAAQTDPQFLLDVRDAPPGVPSRLRLAWYQASQTPQAGELWQLVVSLKRRNGLANPGGFDFEGQLFREGSGATGYVRDDSRNRLLRAPSAQYAVTRVRAWISARLAQAVHEHRMLGVLQGLAVGDTAMMSDEQWRVFAATGTTHLMAISGLHISMIAALAGWIGGAVVRLGGAQARCWNAMHGQVIAGAGAAVCYSFLAGLSIPTQRTMIMLCIYFAARWWRRELPPAHALGLALVAILCVDPFAPLAPGAWLSFGAVAVILMTLAGRLERESALRSFVRVQWAITIGLVPLLLASFGSLSSIAPVANALAVPLFTLIVVPAVLLGALAAAVYFPAGQLLLSVPAALLDATWPLLQWLADQPASLWHFPQVSAPAFVALAAGVLLLVLPGIWPTRLAGALLCLPALLNQPARPERGDFEIALLDVGQGLCVVVRTRSHTLVYDTGPAFQSGRDAAQLAVLPYLHHRGVRQLDALILSHGDLDHRGGTKSILRVMPVARMLAGPSVEEVPAHARRCEQGQRWTWDEVQFEVLHPGGGLAHARDNDSSCVLLVRSGSGSALLAGDIELVAERQLLERGLSHVDAVVVPHHGSKTSSSAAFVAASTPRLALFSVGYRNRWRFPHQQVLERWRAAGARTFTTADSGAVEISFTAQSMRVSEYRRTHRRYWHR